MKVFVLYSLGRPAISNTMPLSSRDGGEKRRGLKNSEKSKGEGRGGKRRGGERNVLVYVET